MTCPICGATGFTPCDLAVHMGARHAPRWQQAVAQYALPVAQRSAAREARRIRRAAASRRAHARVRG